jgi:hypothetical protein
VRQLRRRQRSLPWGDPNDPGYRRLRYSRYADDHLLGFAGPKSEAEQIKARLAAFLRDELRLELSQAKTLVTHARTQAARYLGYEIIVQHADHKVTNGVRGVNGTIGLRVPRAVIKRKCAPYFKNGKPERRTNMLNDSDHAIVTAYGAEYRGLVNYYLLAYDVFRLDRVRRVMLTSMLKTLACKHKSTVSKMADRLARTIETPHGPRRCFQVSVERDGRPPLTATFGGIPLKRKKKAVLPDRIPVPAPLRRKELIGRLLAGRCETCENTGEVEVHHIGKIADLDKLGTPRPAWATLMERKRRKTLIVCVSCHQTIHRRNLSASLTE